MTTPRTATAHLAAPISLHRYSALEGDAPSHMDGGLELVPVDSLKPYKRNARTRTNKDVEAIVASIKRFGFTNPILITEDGRILAGHGRLEAARRLGMTSVPVVRIENLSEADIRAYIIADNKLAERAGWDKELLAEELSYLGDLSYDIQLTGFEIAEVDLLLKYSADQAPILVSRS